MITLLSALTFATVLKAEPMRRIDISAAGISVEVPKAWKNGEREGDSVAVVRVPILNSKVVGKLEFGHVNDPSADSAGFQESQKEILTRAGATVVRQWTVETLGAPFVFTKSSKDNQTTIRGVFFRATKSKFVVKLSAPSDQFEKVEPVLGSTLATLKEAKLKEDTKRMVPQERKVVIMENLPGNIAKTPVSQPIKVSGKNYLLRLPAGCEASKMSDSSVAVKVPGLNQAVIIDCYDQTVTPVNKSFAEKPASTAKLFAGAVTRVDQLVPVRKDMQQRQYVWRTGISATKKEDMMTCDVLVVQLKQQYMFASYVQRDRAFFKADRKALESFINSIKLDEKQ